MLVCNRLAQRACFSLPRAQRGSVSERRAALCCLSPSPRQDRRVSRPAACVRQAERTASRPAQGWGGIRWFRKALAGVREGAGEKGLYISYTLI
jgi:hypothetical protein